MKTKKYFLTIVFQFLCCWMFAQLSKTEELFTDSIMNANYKSNGPGATILIAKAGKPVFRKAYGLANIELNVKNKPEYAFRIASVSKQVISVCILKLAEEGKLSLQDDIRKYLADYNTHGRKITIEEILRHTAGIPNYTAKEDFFAKASVKISIEELKKSFMNDSLLFEPNSNYCYSNSDYVLAGLIIEKISGKPLNEFLDEQIFKPCEMKSTFVGNDDSVFVNAVTGYSVGPNNRHTVAPFMSWCYMYGCGGIISTVDDLLKFNNALLSEKIIKKEWLEKAWQSFILPSGEPINYGLGWGVGEFKGLKYLEHGGLDSGFSSDAAFFPSKQLYMVILSNTDVGPWSFFATLACKLNGLHVSQPSPVQPGIKALKEYEGVYSFREAFTMLPMQRLITMENGHLYSKVKEEEDVKEELLCINKDFFTIAKSAQKYQFIRDKSGKIISLKIHSEPFKHGPDQINIKTEVVSVKN